ncbi:MAG: hypothetical protein L6Q54_03750 [Leptospiraceae bacterium]|nr:arginine-tRNA-protein transferase [Leptospiraceae bacterium]MCK6380349.1 hypothetical protein [Leptospiraceae bacterium]NUM40872.1 arginine-tRNA-protein transferase [Leptospiraceae bacterium]
MIYDRLIAAKVSPTELDEFLRQGFRHFGVNFFRYSSSYLDEELEDILPLRINLTTFQFSDSQKKILKKNKDLLVSIRDSFIDPEKEKLFSLHKKRFKENEPESIYTFLSEEPSVIPCENKEVAVFYDDRLVAVSFLDIGKISTSSIYAIFDPLYSKRSLGIFTLLKEIEYSIETKKKYFYHGYAFKKPSFYDYKKNFHSLEYFDWDKKWIAFSK